METTYINATQKYCTDDQNVIRLLSVKRENNKGFELYKTTQVDTKNRNYRWIYFLMVEGEKFPIIITDNAASDILRNPQHGMDLVDNYQY